MKNWIICTAFAAVTALAAAGCSTERSDGQGSVQGRGPVMNTVSIAVSDSTWTYFSIERGGVVGTCLLSDRDADRQWAMRDDWDFALCGDMMRTNSGTSGPGKGGVQAVTRQNFNALEQAPVSGYVEDRDDIVVRR